MAHIFITFVEENAKLASWVADQLRANGLEPWFSKDDGRIVPGDHWKTTLSKSIRDGGFYLPLFTREWAARQRTVANDELAQAVDEYRQRGLYRRWFVPVVVDAGAMPDMPLGAGQHLSDLQYVDIPRLGWERGLKSLLNAFGVERPVLDVGEPLAPGLGAVAEVTGGFVTYRNVRPPVPILEGLSFTAMGGRVWRETDGRIRTRFHLRAPFEELEAVNEQLGLNQIDVLAKDHVISTDPKQPTLFHYLDPKEKLPAGFKLWHPGVEVRTTVPVDQVTGFDAKGYLDARDRMVGTFTGFVDTKSALVDARVTFDGEFELAMRSVIQPPSE